MASIFGAPAGMDGAGGSMGGMRHPGGRFHSSARRDQFHRRHPMKQRQRVMRPRPQQQPRIEDRGVKRELECPCAARLYLLKANDISTGHVVCSAILGVPSAVQVPALQDATGDPAASPTSVDPKPVAVYMVWADTTLLELAMEALRASRSWADAEFATAAGQAQLQKTRRIDDGAPGDKAASGVGSLAGDAELPHYQVELLCGFVNGEGKAVVLGLGIVVLRQVMAKQPELVFPVRQMRGGVDYNTVATEVGFGYGNPILFSCTRIR